MLYSYNKKLPRLSDSGLFLTHNQTSRIFAKKIHNESQTGI